MEIPEALLTQISEGRVVLLLGAGASLDAQTSDGKKAPSTNELRDQKKSPSSIVTNK
jgi:hypothetical protein